MRNRILNILKNADGYISGEKISNTFNISRSAVFKHIKKLREEGYEIASSTNRGYKLITSSDTVTEEKIKAGLTTNYTAQNIILFDEVDSTNNAAKREADMPNGTLFISEIQTGGKGRLGRAWSSPRGEGIWMSVLLKPNMLPQDVAQITLIAGMAVAKGIGCGAVIKWPNDVIIGTKKVCGILTEMSAEIERVNYVVCGIGINVNTPEFDSEIADKATSLYLETGTKHERSPIISNIMNEFERIYEKFRKEGIRGITDEYRTLCVTVGRDVKVIYPDHEFSGKAVGIDDSGRLIVKTADKSVAVNSGEVSVRGIYGYV